MAHGLALQPRWDGVGEPPIISSPPFLGLPALEVNHPFDFEMSPSMMLGPKCNHDIGILLRMPLPSSIRSGDDGSSREVANASHDAARDAMIESIGDHEYYCAAYSSKDQPHIDGLLMTLADGLRAKEADLARAKEAGEDLTAHEEARRILHRLVSSTNRRMHKGFPEMLSYLMHKPMEYSSHAFAHVSFEFRFRTVLAHVHARVERLPCHLLLCRTNARTP